MANNRAYEIAFVGLALGVHEFNYEVDNKFFVEKGATEFTNGNANVKLNLEYEGMLGIDLRTEPNPTEYDIKIATEIHELLKQVRNKIG